MQAELSHEPIHNSTVTAAVHEQSRLASCKLLHARAHRLACGACGSAAHMPKGATKCVRLYVASGIKGMLYFATGPSVTKYAWPVKAGGRQSYLQVRNNYETRRAARRYARGWQANVTVSCPCMAVRATRACVYVRMRVLRVPYRQQ